VRLYNRPSTPNFHTVSQSAPHTNSDGVKEPDTTLELEMSTIEVSEQVEESPAEAALKIEARVYGSVAPYTDEQLKAIRPSK